ncbi:MAG: RQC domain-containing protein [Candidatus Binatia bacterium]
MRCVIHTALPKSVEHYQQETGRAGRDGLEAECVLLYSGADVVRIERLLERSAADAAAACGAPPDSEAGDPTEAARQLLRHMQRFASGLACRHKTLSEYFGQPFASENCRACDVCLDEVEGVGDATVTAQKILSAVARAEGFGVTHVVDILVGADTERVRARRHDALSTYGLLKDLPRPGVTAMVHQLVDQRLLDRSVGDRPVLRLNAASWEVLRGQRTVQLVQPRAKAAPAPTRVDGESWEGVDRDLFDHLRQLRRELAEARGVPPYIIFNDATLRDLACRSPDLARRLRRHLRRRRAASCRTSGRCSSSTSANGARRADGTLERGDVTSIEPSPVRRVGADAPGAASEMSATATTVLDAGAPLPAESRHCSGQTSPLAFSLRRHQRQGDRCTEQPCGRGRALAAR